MSLKLDKIAKKNKTIKQEMWNVKKKMIIIYVWIRG